MTAWLIAAAVGMAAAVLLYGWREPSGLGRLAPLVALRALSLTVLIALLLNAPTGRRRPAARLVALDVSSSWLRGRDTATWNAARERVRTLGPDSVVLFGDSSWQGPPPALPTGTATRAASVAEQALASGRPVLILTDGELDDPDALSTLPPGSRVEVLPPARGRDLAVVSLDAPRSAVSRDTIDIRVTLRTDRVAAGPSTLALMLGERTLATLTIDALPPNSERVVTRSVPVGVPQGTTTLVAAVTSPGDSERRNDTVRVVLEVARAAAAVLVSTSPDFDSRFLLPVLRGAVSLPTRAYFRIAPAVWRTEGSLAPVPEAAVRRALNEAPLAILHGDTALFGAPLAATSGAIALLPVPADTGSEWYAVAAPPSPIAAALGGVPWDSLAPLEVAARLPTMDWEGVIAARGRRFERRVVAAGGERPRRTVVVGASGLWRWQFRGGGSADAYATLWGSIFDWLAAERPDARPAVPPDGVVRAGEPIRWRRGRGGDSLVIAVVRRRNAEGREDSLPLRFGAGGTVAESDPLSAGTYDVRLPGGSALVVVNASRELLPQAPVVRSGAVGGRATAGDFARIRDSGWAYLVILAALCAEWLSRRRLGLR